MADDQYPCFSSDVTTHCCQQYATCLQNSLCLPAFDTSINTGACTDDTWANPVCFQSCLSPRTNSLSTLFRCNDNNWCCSQGGNTTSCCSDPNVDTFKLTSWAYIQNGTDSFASGYSIAPLAALASTSSSLSSPSTISAALTSSQTSTATCASGSSTGSTPNCSSSNTAIGVGVGVGVGIPLLALVGLFSLLWFRARKRSKPVPRVNEMQGVSQGQANMLPPKAPVEVPAYNDNPFRHELPQSQL